jgi:branched-chain amino acid aminotransferase
MNEHFYFYNDQFYHSDEPAITAGNRGLRYGDGIFETMRMYKGRILNEDFHFERWFLGMKMLQFQIPPHFSPGYFKDAISRLLKKNAIDKNARIRMMIFRSDGNIFDLQSSPGVIIEAFSLSEKIELNHEGLKIDVFHDIKKSAGSFSNLKSNNYLPSVMAALFAKQNLLDDALILNSFERVCESAIANIFIIKDKIIYTPPLSEGCVAGVMRRWMLERFSFKKYSVKEKMISVNDVLNADEIFLTNSVSILKWVRDFQQKIFGNEKIKEFFSHILPQL